MDVKEKLKNNPVSKKPYMFLKSIKDKRIHDNLFGYHGKFEDRRKSRKKLCIVLAGYKDFLFKPVFTRIERYIQEDIDVCVVSSGLYSDVLADLCRKNDWSYLSTKENDVSLVQNIAIYLHPNAEYIYKLDEDVFIPKDFFQRMMDVYNQNLNGDYDPGVVAPLLLVNGYTSLRILRLLKIENEFTNKFGLIKYAAGPEKTIEKDANAARFMWGEGGVVPHIDEINNVFSKMPKNTTPCPIRFSIGAILFPRYTWEHMNYFDVDRKDKNMMGKDEVKICRYCCINSRPIIVTDNVVVGHFSFGSQTEGMKEYYLQHPERFMIQD